MKLKLVKNWKKTLINLNSTIEDAIKTLTTSSLRICLIVDKKFNLIGVINDGDIRRGLTKGLSLNSKIREIINKKPITLKSTKVDEIFINQIRNLDINLIPLIKGKKKVIGLLNSNLEIFYQNNDTEVIILGGGIGKRLRPLTLKKPKPLIKINDKSVIDIVFDKISFYGFRNFTLMLKYQSNKIIKHIKNRSNKNLNYKFFIEKKYLGTAGSLFFLKNKIKKSFIVTNCDVISDINYLDFLKFHKKKKSSLTLVVKEIQNQSAFGVLKTQGIKIKDIEEKPISNVIVNCGIYALDPKILSLMKKNSEMDMVSLIKKAIKKKYKVLVYQSYDNWIDIGNKNSLKIAKKYFNDSNNKKN